MKKKKPTRAEQGEATRASILAAARQRFAADGYDRATIRAIAADAGIDPSLVMRYFGNKQGLFVAAAEIDLRLPDFAKLARKDMAAAAIEHFLDRWSEDDIMQALLRTSATNEDAAERMRSLLATQTVPLVAAMCGDPKSAPIRAGLINSQILGFAYFRFVLKVPSIVAMRRADIVKWLGATVHRYLFAEMP